jgi:hypothetical protein
MRRNGTDEGINLSSAAVLPDAEKLIPQSFSPSVKASRLSQVQGLFPS